MTLEQKLDTVLKADTAVAQSVGPRIYAGKAPPDTSAPYLVWQVISSQPENSHDTAPDLTRALVQLSAYGASYLDAVIAARRALTALISAFGLDLIPEIDANDEIEDDVALHRRDVELIIHHAFSAAPAAT